MAHDLLALLVGAATVLLVAALSLPLFHGATYDQAGKLQTRSGLWTQVLTVHPSPPNARKYCKTVANDECENGSNPDCAWSGGKCISANAMCAPNPQSKCGKKKTDPGGTRCAWWGGRCRHKHDYGVAVDASMPWSDAHGGRTAMMWARALGFVAVGLGVVTVALAATETPHPLLCALTSAAATGAGLALLVVYATSLADTFGLSKQLRAAFEQPCFPASIPTPWPPPPLPPPTPMPPLTPGCILRGLIDGLIDDLFSDGGKYKHADALLAQADVHKYGASYWLAAGAVGLLAVATGVGVVEARRER